MQSITTDDKYGNILVLTPSDSTHVFVACNVGGNIGKPYPYHIGQLEGKVLADALTLIEAQRDESGRYCHGLPPSKSKPTTELEPGDVVLLCKSGEERLVVAEVEQPDAFVCTVRGTKVLRGEERGPSFFHAGSKSVQEVLA